MNCSLMVADRMKNLKLSDEMFFTSGYFAGYMENILRIPCTKIKRQTPRVVVIYDHDPRAPMAYTDNHSITLNAAGRMVEQQTSREMKTVVLIGLLTHEFGHFRFTDFTSLRTAQKMLSQSIWWPKIPVKELDATLAANMEDSRLFMISHPNKLCHVVATWHSMQNIIEDGIIEESCYRVLSGQMTDGLSLVRTIQFTGAIPLSETLDALEKQYLTPIEVMSNLMLVYAKYGQLKYDRTNERETKSPILQLFKRVMPLIDRTLYASDSSDRIVGVHKIYLTLWPLIKEMLLTLPNAVYSAQSKSPASRLGDSSGLKSTNPSVTFGRGTAVSKDEDAEHEGKTFKEMRAKTKKELMGEDDSEDGAPETGEDDSEDGAPETGEDDSEDVTLEKGEDDSEDVTLEKGEDDSEDVTLEKGEDDSEDVTPEKGEDDSEDVTPEKGEDDSEDVTPEKGEDDSEDVTPEKGEDDSEDVTPEKGEDDSEDVTPEKGEDDSEDVTPEKGEDDSEDVTPEKGEDDSEDGTPEKGEDDSEDGTPEKGEDDSELPTPKKDDVSEGQVNCPNDGMLSLEDIESSVNLDEVTTALSKISKQVRSQIAIDETNRDLSQALQSEASDLDYGAAHRGLHVVVQRINQVTEDMKVAFERYGAPCREVATSMAKKIAPLLKRADEDTMATSGFFSGSKFDATRLVAGDWKYFRQSVCPTPDGGTALSVLVDLSGSMRGPRIDMARHAAIATYLFAEQCNIKCSVIGHTAKFDGINLTLEMFADYDTPDDCDKYRLMNISERADNRDGAAILFAGEHLLKRPEKVKLMIIISDGAPIARGYYGKSAEADMSKIVAELRRQGVVIFAAAIGSDKENIHRIFGEGFLDITNLQNMPDELLQLIRRYIR